MNKHIEIFKKNKLITCAIISLISIVFIYFLVNSSKSRKKEEIKNTTKSVSEYNGLIPGKATKDEIFEVLGKPLNAQINDNYEEYEFKSSNQNLNNVVIVKDNTLNSATAELLIKDGITSIDLLNKYGQPESKLYGVNYNSGYLINAYPSKGIAYLYHLNSGNVSKIWYFKPTSIESLKREYLVGYSESPRIIQ
jgi:hypothetical protein